MHLVLSMVAATAGGTETTIMNSAGLAPLLGVSTPAGEEKSKLSSNKRR